MALIIEDGSVVTGANSYVSLVDAQAYATERGLGVTVTEAMLLEAMDYIEALRADFQGSKTYKANPLQWPRIGVVVDGFDIDVDEIPSILVQAQARLACDSATTPLQPTADGREVLKEIVEGAVEVDYAETGNSNQQPQLTAASALLAPLLKSALVVGGLRTVRV